MGALLLARDAQVTDTDNNGVLGYVKMDDKLKVEGLVKMHNQIYAEVIVEQLLKSLKVIT